MRWMSLKTFINRNFERRVWSAIVAVLVSLGSLYYSAYSLGALTMFVMWKTQNELYLLLGLKKFNRILGIVLSYVLYLLCFIYRHQNNWVQSKDFLWLLPALLLVFVINLFTQNTKTNPFLEAGSIVLGVVYIGGSMSMINWLVTNAKGEYVQHLFVALLLVVWTNDIGGYCFGRLIGKHKLFPQLSPKKTWEGLVGGVAVSMVTGAFAFTLNNETMLNSKIMVLWEAILLSIFISVVGVVGDLVISHLKRTSGVKDSGNFMPGHGGMLDRMDSLLFALAFVGPVLVWLKMC